MEYTIIPLQYPDGHMNIYADLPPGGTDAPGCSQGWWQAPDIPLGVPTALNSWGADSPSIPRAANSPLWVIIYPKVPTDPQIHTGVNYLKLTS